MKWPINCKPFGATSAKTEELLAGATAHWRFQYQSWIWSPSLALLSRTSRLRKNGQNGQRLLELCSLRNLCITYTFFEDKPQHYVSWKPPRSHRWHQLDLLITRPRSLLNVLSTRSYHSADCNTDHVLVCNSTAQRNQAIPAKTLQALLTQRQRKFLSKVQEAFEDPQGQDATSRWDLLREAIHSSAMSALGGMDRPSHSRFNASLPIMEPIIEVKQQAHLKYKKNPCEKMLTALPAARSLTQSTANDYWLKLRNDIQLTTVLGNIRGM